MSYSGPVAVVAAAVAAQGDMVLVRAQDMQLAAPPTITQVDYRYTNISSIEMTSQFVQTSTAPGCAACTASRDSGTARWGSIGLTILLMGVAAARRRLPRKPGASR